MSKKLYYYMILGLGEKSRVQAGNLTTRTVSVPLPQVMKNTDLQFSSDSVIELCRPG